MFSIVMGVFSRFTSEILGMRLEWCQSEPITIAIIKKGGLCGAAFEWLVAR